MLGHNALKHTFGGFAQATWAGVTSSHPKAASDFLFRLGGGAPAVYRPKAGGGTHYQFGNPGYWPIWGGGDDLAFGWFGALGENGMCDQGHGYSGERNAACGGSTPGSWGATEMEVWYRTGP